jgi:hypothetical protein
MFLRLTFIYFSFIFFIGVVQSDPTTHLLFVGNSLTYTNDLPSLVEKYAKTKGILVKTEMIVFPNYGLEDHWNDKEIHKLVKSKNYDYVIVQQGPSSQEYGRTSLLKYGKKISNLCYENKSKLVFFMVWPSKKFYHTYDGVINNYSNAANELSALLCPVGKVWKSHFDKTKDFSYYSDDGFHPSLKGSKIAAEVIVKSILIN